jgi:hypothetical protein
LNAFLNVAVLDPAAVADDVTFAALLEHLVRTDSEGKGRLVVALGHPCIRRNARPSGPCRRSGIPRDGHHIGAVHPQAPADAPLVQVRCAGAHFVALDPSVTETDVIPIGRTLPGDEAEKLFLSALDFVWQAHGLEGQAEWADIGELWFLASQSMCTPLIEPN